jgi:hypothetical protein
MGGVGKDDKDMYCRKKSPGSDKTKVNGCHACTTENPRYEVTSSSIGNYIQHMKDHTLIGKFMGIWPSEKSLNGWVSSRWKIKGKVDLKLGSKGLLYNHLC